MPHLHDMHKLSKHVCASICRAVVRVRDFGASKAEAHYVFGNLLELFLAAQAADRAACRRRSCLPAGASRTNTPWWSRADAVRPADRLGCGLRAVKARHTGMIEDMRRITVFQHTRCSIPWHASAATKICFVPVALHRRSCCFVIGTQTVCRAVCLQQAAIVGCADTEHAAGELAAAAAMCCCESVAHALPPDKAIHLAPLTAAALAAPGNNQWTAARTCSGGCWRQSCCSSRPWCRLPMGPSRRRCCRWASPPWLVL